MRTIATLTGVVGGIYGVGGGSLLAPKYEWRLAEGPHTMAVSKDPMFSAMLRDTFAPTLLSSGIRSNVIPSEAKAAEDSRTKSFVRSAQRGF